MSISRGNTPAVATAADGETAPHCRGLLGQCRVGDWIYPADVFEWWGLTGTRRYQPGGKHPFDPACFDRNLPVWIFERHDHPLVRGGDQAFAARVEAGEVIGGGLTCKPIASPPPGSAGGREPVAGSFPTKGLPYN